MSHTNRVSAPVANGLVFLNLIQRGPATGQAGLVGFDSNADPSLCNIAGIIARGDLVSSENVSDPMVLALKASMIRVGSSRNDCAGRFWAVWSTYLVIGTRVPRCGASFFLAWQLCRLGLLARVISELIAHCEAKTVCSGN